MMVWPEDYVNKIVHGDCIEVMKYIPDKSINSVITDPPWPGCDIEYDGKKIENPKELFTRAVKEIARITDRLVVHLGCMSDPRFLSEVPESLPFFRVCWLRRIPASYHGSVMNGADVAYVFGHGGLPGDGSRVIGGECNHCSTGIKDIRVLNHPVPRMMDHVQWLVKWFSRPGDIILDPFCGSGSTLIAAKHRDRNYIGIDDNENYVNLARSLVARVAPQKELGL